MTKLVFNGKKLKELRQNKGLTLEELAKEIDSSKSYIWELENKSANIGGDKLIILSDFFDVPANDFYIIKQESMPPVIFCNSFGWNEIPKFSKDEEPYSYNNEEQARYIKADVVTFLRKQLEYILDKHNEFIEEKKRRSSRPIIYDNSIGIIAREGLNLTERYIK